MGSKTFPHWLGNCNGIEARRARDRPSGFVVAKLVSKERFIFTPKMLMRGSKPPYERGKIVESVATEPSTCDRLGVLG